MIFEQTTVTSVLLSAVAGFALGGFYFWGLWWTSRQVGTTSAPGLLFFTSFVVRMTILLLGIYFVTGARLLEVFSSVVGLLIARRIVIRAVKRKGLELPEAAEPERGANDGG